MVQVIAKAFQDNPSNDDIENLQALFIGYQTKQERTYSHIPKTVQAQKSEKGESWEEGLRMVTPNMKQVQKVYPKTDQKQLKNKNYHCKEEFSSKFDFLESPESRYLDKFLAC